MANHDTNAISVTELVAQLSEESLSEIDFDAIKIALETTDSGKKALKTLSGELALLREDYISRIIGMAKALAVARQTEGALMKANALVDSLPALTASQLVEQYRLASARFRDAFPASFGISGASQRRMDARRKYSDFK